MLLAGAPARAQSGTMPTVNNPLASNAAMGTNEISPSVRRNLSSDLSTLVSLRLEDVTLEQALQRIAEKGDLNLIYGSYAALSEKSVALRLEQVSARAALEEALRGTDLRPVLSSNGQVVLVNEPGPEAATTMKARGLDLEVSSITAAPAAEAVPRRLQQVQEGTIEGTVTEAETGKTIPGVNVIVVDLPEQNLGAATDAEGQYEIEGVPAGEHTIRAQFVGYQSQTQSVEVVAGETVTVDFELGTSTMDLDEVVVTGQAGRAKQKEIGNAISQVDPAELQKPDLGLESMLQGEVTGMVVSQTSGMAGSGSYIRLRGNSSVTQGNQPLVYIDGVRVRSEGYAKNVPPVGYSGRSGNVAASPLNGINSSNIARVEVIKGAAATTLYGTEASAGVIQIFTKEGSEDSETRYNVNVDQTLDRVLPFGTEEAPYIYIKPWLRNSYGQNYSLSARGGTNDFSFFLSGSYGDDRAPLPNDRERKYAVRGNLGFQATSDLEVQWNTSITQRNITNTPAGDNAQGLVLNAYRQETNYVGTSQASSTFKEEIDRLLQYDISTEITNVTSGLTLRYAPSEQHNQSLTLGYDRTFQGNRQVRPFGFILAPEGKMSAQRWTNQLMTVDYTSSYDVDLSEGASTTISGGGQIVVNDLQSTTGYAEDFPGPGEPTLSSGALTLSFEERIREVNAGIFVQNRLSLGDRVFLTTGLRADGNTAFGEDLGVQLYPKVSVSYVLSDEAFWNESWGTLKLRAAYGHAGRAPGAFDAVRTWQPNQLGNQPAFLPENRGNPNLGPERTEEVEAGFDASILDERLSTTFTYYHQITRNALFPVRQVPSSGGWGSQIENVGKIRNTGVELDVDGAILRSDALSWDLGFSLSTNFSKALDLGEAASFEVGSGAYIEEGFSVPVLRGPKVQNPNEQADPVYEEHHYGPNLPTHTVRLDTRVEFLGGIVFSALGEFMGGNYINDLNTEGKISRGQNSWPTCLDTFDQVEQQGMQSLTALQRSRCLASQAASDSFIHPADFFKVRNLSLAFPLDRFVSDLDNPTLTLSVRNALRWFNNDWPILDPEIGSNTGQKSFVIQPQEHIPPPATFSVSLQFGF
jgi:outer membrane receptor protein involved in Fe transport